MYLTYIDESGKPERTDPEKEYVLAALTINESSWRDVDRRVRGLKQKYFPNVPFEEVELHANEIFNHTKSFKNMDLKTRLDIYRDTLAIVSDIDCNITAVIVRKDELKSPTLEIDMFTMELLFERLCYHLKVENGNNKFLGKDEQFSILMIDSVNPKYDGKVRSKLRVLFENGTRYEKNDYMIEDPIFVDSSYRHLSQLVDCVAYCIRRQYRKADVDEAERETFDSFFRMIESKILRNVERPYYGLKVFP